MKYEKDSGNSHPYFPDKFKNLSSGIQETPEFSDMELLS
jgi:hypothetical protein